MSVELLLKSHLKTLKLPTILQEYARAVRQCAQEDRSFEEFLHYLSFVARIDNDSCFSSAFSFQFMISTR